MEFTVNFGLPNHHPTRFICEKTDNACTRGHSSLTLRVNQAVFTVVNNESFFFLFPTFYFFTLEE